ncbi:hypothetical protein SDJN03_06942, partial [Cucurbita argyrosperma subsp. sororia]
MENSSNPPNMPGFGAEKEEMAGFEMWLCKLPLQEEELLAICKAKKKSAFYYIKQVLHQKNSMRTKLQMTIPSTSLLQKIRKTNGRVCYLFDGDMDIFGDPDDLPRSIAFS